MTHRFRFLLCAASLCLCAACPADDDPEETGSDTDAGSTGAATTIILSGEITGFAEMAGIAGAQVCIWEHPEVACVMTDADGAYALPGVPMSLDGAVEVTAAGHIPALLWGNTGDEDATVNAALLSDAAEILFEQAIGIDFDPTKGHIATGANDGTDGVAGASFTLAPDSGTRAYIGDNSLPDTTATETSTNGVMGWGNVDPGEVEITASHPTLTCTNVSSGRMTIVAGYFNSLSGGFTCV